MGTIEIGFDGHKAEADGGERHKNPGYKMSVTDTFHRWSLIVHGRPISALKRIADSAEHRAMSEKYPIVLQKSQTVVANV